MESKNNKKNKDNWPATLYVEGQDQFRGWFNSSLITSVILTNQSPYQQVLTHGFTVDEKGHKMSKSLGNFIDSEEIIEKFGTDILRLWVVSSDFTKEVKVSISILENLQESYQKIRNTLRFLLSNLNNLPPEIKNEEDLKTNLNPVDYYILCKLEKLVVESQKNYNEYNFNSTYSSLLNFCINDLSSFYFEVSKDSLYCDSLYSARRREIITTIYYLLQGLLKIIYPILPFLAEEVYQNISFSFGFANQESVHLVNYSSILPLSSDSKKKTELITNFFLPLRQDVYQALERARQGKVIGTNSQAHLIIFLKREWNYSGLILEELLLVAEVEVNEIKEGEAWEGNFCSAKVLKTSKEKCIRCWNYRDLENSFCLRCRKLL